MTNMFDPDFDPLEMLTSTMEAVAHQQRSIEVLLNVYNKLNKQVFELSKINSLQSSKIMRLEARLNAIEQASANSSTGQSQV